VQSVEVGTALLRALADADGPRSLSALARAAGMSSAKAHRYLVSFVQAGLVVQSERSAAYDLGPLAVRLGLAAIERFDVVRVAGERLGELRDRADATSMLSLWTDEGPTVARIELSRHPVTLAVRAGTTFPVASTATGQVFLAYGAGLSSNRLAAELAALPHGQLEALRSRVREAGVASVDQTFLVGVRAVAAPLFHGDGRLAAVLTVIGPERFDLSREGAVAEALRGFVRSLTAGYAVG
jgi:DNA-binding IclR family transcriptional regulator